MASMTIFLTLVNIVSATLLIMSGFIRIATNDLYGWREIAIGIYFMWNGFVHASHT